MCAASILALVIAPFTDGFFSIVVTLYPAFSCGAFDLLSMWQLRWLVVIGLLMIWCRMSYPMKMNKSLAKRILIETECESMLNMTYIF